MQNRHAPEAHDDNSVDFNNNQTINQPQNQSQNQIEPIDLDGEVIVQRIILPSRFIGSKRQSRESYRDAMSVVARKGKPDLVIT